MPKVSRADAKHEAAHAVVSVRLGLPLDYTTVGGGGAPIESVQLPGYDVRSAGYTTVIRGTAQRWIDALPDERAAEQLRRFAAQAAAGIVAEMERGASVYDHAHRGDLHSVVKISGVLGVGTSTADAPVRAFIESAIQLAGDTLIADGGAAWDRVTTALLRKRKLTGAEVRAIVGD